jgi:uncharacterized membrane protein YfcA
VAQAAFLVAAGILAGIVGTSGASGGMISYPALLAVGIPPLPANVTQAIAVVGSGLGSTARSQPELRGSLRQLVRWSILAAAGAATGTALLLLAPGEYFVWVVPFLVAGAATLLLLQPRIGDWRQQRPLHRAVLPYGLFGVGLYEGYFGAASGVMTLALLMLTLETQLVRANALKNTLLGVADVVAAISFAIFGPVYWAAALALGLGYLAGGMIGPVVARRIPSDTLRLVIVAAGFGLAAWLLAQAIGG